MNGGNGVKTEVNGESPKKYADIKEWLLAPEPRFDLDEILGPRKGRVRLHRPPVEFD